MKVCIIVPLYNDEMHIQRCVDSILQQEHDDYLLIIVDDGSIDSSSLICDKYSSIINNIIVVHKKNGGAGSARNVGLDLIANFNDCGWITFVDSDDRVLSSYLHNMVQCALDCQSDIVKCDCIICEDNQSADLPYASKKMKNVTPKILGPEELWCQDRNSCVVPWMKLYSKSLIAELRFPEISYGEDEFFSYRILFKTNKIAVFPLPLYVYYVNYSGMVHSYWSPKRLEALSIIEKQVEFLWDNGFFTAANKSANDYMYFLNDAINQMKKYNSCSKYRSMINEIKKKERDFIRKYHKRYGFPIEGNEWVFAIVYPIRAKMKMIVRKLIFTKHEGSILHRIF